MRDTRGMNNPLLIPLVCVNCGGGLETTPTADLFRCPYCKQLMLLAQAHTPTPQRVATRLVAREEWPANALRPGDTHNWQGGTLYLADDVLAFVPHAFNFGALEQATIPLGAIVDAELQTGFISDDLHVRTRDGATWGLRVRKGEVLRDALRARGIAAR